MSLTEIASLLPAPILDGLVYQYTKWPALLGMVRTTRNGCPSNPYFVIRSYNASFMNDGDECRIGYQSFLNELKKRKYYLGKQLTERNFKAIQSKILKGQSRYYISSFAKAKDCLPMWRTYGEDGNGIAIGLDSHSLAENGFPIFDCIYDSPKIKAIARELCQWAEKRAVKEMTDDEVLLFNNYIYMLSCLAKNAHFDYEQESRLCSYFEIFQNKSIASFNNGKHLFDIHFECAGGKIVSYIEIEMPISVVKEIWIGPTNNMESSLASLEMWLQSMELFNIIEIHSSTAPLK